MSKLVKYGIFLPYLSESGGTIVDEIAKPIKYAEPKSPRTDGFVHVKSNF